MIDNNENKHYLLLNVKQISTFETIDIRSTTTNKPEFPSGSDILKFSRKICWDDVNLPSSVKQGCQLLDQINVPHISFKKDPVMKYKEETYYLYYYHQIFDVIKELLSNPDIFQHCNFEFVIIP